MKKSRGFPLTMNYFGGGGGGGGGGGREVGDGREDTGKQREERERGEREEGDGRGRERGGGGGRDRERDPTTTTTTTTSTSNPPPPPFRRYSESLDYHNYPTAQRNYPMTGANVGVRELRSEMRKSADEATLFANKGSEYRGEVPGFRDGAGYRNEGPRYRNEVPESRNENQSTYRTQDPNYRNQDPNYRNQDPNYRNQDPNYRNQDPNYRNQDPNYRNQDPNYRNQAPGYQNNPPSYRNDPPSYRHDPPSYRNDPPSYRNDPPSYRNDPPSYRNDPPSYRHQDREIDGSRGYPDERGGLENGYRPQRDYGSLSRHPPPSYNTHYTPSGEYNTTPRPEYRPGGNEDHGTDTGHGTDTNSGTGKFQARNRYYKTAEDYHHDYRGGYRPSPFDTDGYTTDGSGSGYRDGSVGSARGFENYRYPESESLLPGRRPDGAANAYPRGEGGGGGGGGGERQPFLGGGGGGVEPVRLTPSWENSNLPKEELNFRSVNTYEAFEVGLDPPKDRYKLVFLTLVLHGVGTLMPWNMFITAKNYFVEYKLNTDDEELSGYSTNFLPYIGYAAQVPNVLFNWLNIFVQMGGNLTTRIVWSILVEVVVFVITVVLAMVDSADWPGAFFWVTMASVVVLNVANGIYQNTVYGMAARLPFSYTGAVVLGSNISGTFTAVINIMAIAVAPNVRTSAIYYFITALFVLLACFDTYFALPLNRFFRYHEAVHERTQRAAKRDPSMPRVPYWHIFKSAFPQLFNVFMVFFVTLAVFPAVLADTCRTEENFPITPKYFQAVTCFLTFNVFAMLGNMLPGLVTWPGPRFLCVPVLLRIFFIPAFVLCHFYPVKVERIMPVLIDSDWAFWGLAVALGITSGYYSSLAMMYCPRTVEPEYAPVAGMMGAASLITGIFTGIVFQIVCTLAVTNITFEIPGYTFPFRNCTDRLPPAT
ncbi:uncharacterized protein LOC126992796 isoform X3 [Eriocheir sinensis]|uniref:uncharacterized protein LOC126992796 isoform X3 n=1 Tax=Eriocheir sinensis TaxID=95602 RepID=UPI0021C67C13|nr:uncharacterized protein LOC126992796 isoform X3 [Eriocheir sinensis]